ncbi:hypothetical protein L2E82_12195 [Cichorium intybus]|uniref:Uncharacterized protein n=1 Tax=Cichorium intybus TaxID=13427 RepID=A0ACB9GGG3_CICIN|nr:hypothetical protein L2E82_12195 [Cichorium intybus]
MFSALKNPDMWIWDAGADSNFTVNEARRIFDDSLLPVDNELLKLATTKRRRRMMSIQSTSSLAPSSVMSTQQSPWHSPVPYLFGDLAAMLGLIGFALLLLACSY